MTFDPSLWQRFEFDHIPVYLNPQRPAWFVPTDKADQVLQKWQQGAKVHGLAEHRLAARLPEGDSEPYAGRASVLGPPQLRELWLHLTHRCNLACNHCLFVSGPQQEMEMAAEQVLLRANEAYEMGCRVFALTGGEPLFHRDFDRILSGLLALEGAQVVILTNGLLLQQMLDGKDYDFRRIFLQVSVDGLQQRHDAVRGDGSFEGLQQQFAWLRQQKIPFTVSMCVEKDNLVDMPSVVEFAAEQGAGNVHFMWYFIRGRGVERVFASPAVVFDQLLKAQAVAEKAGIGIDNFDSLRSQVFAPAGTIHDGSSGGWTAAAIGPDDRLYPTAATVGLEALSTVIDEGLQPVWQQSPVLGEIRQATAASLDDPFRYLLGGGDLDHSYIATGDFVGTDPYLSLYQRMALWLITREAKQTPDLDRLQLRLKMGDLLESCGANGAVALTHSNCLLSVAHSDTRSKVGDFYAAAVGDTKEDILNPICYDEDLIRHIPAEFRFRGYGCGSPVLDAELQSGETVVDLGCGSGVECFVAALEVGPKGRSIGVDMLDPMLELAQRGAEGVRTNLGYDNLDFRKGYLENLPLEDNEVDCILSNCVMNLSPNKRQSFGEILRVLKPGGRLVISDVVCETEPGAAIRNDEILQGECIGGALTQKDLMGLLEETGFEQVRLIKRFPYRVVQGHPFFSLTFEAIKPEPTLDLLRVIYRGPFASVVTESGQVLQTGRISEIPAGEASALGDQVFVLDESGTVTNLEAQNACACALPPSSADEACCAPVEENADACCSPAEPVIDGCCGNAEQSGCMVCGDSLVYGDEQEIACHYCHRTFHTTAVCSQGHFICDDCHAGDAQAIIEQILLQTDETDMLALFNRLHEHPSFKVHGPEHHGLMPGVILTTYRNLGGEIDQETILAGIRRGNKVAGGSCAYTGICGAAAGVGIAFSLLLDATPVKPGARQSVQGVVGQVVQALAGFEAARCCLRDCSVALQEAARISSDLLPVPLKAESQSRCHQKAKNAECYGARCPLA